MLSLSSSTLRAKDSEDVFSIALKSAQTLGFKLTIGEVKK